MKDFNKYLNRIVHKFNKSFFLFLFLKDELLGLQDLSTM